jgi:hypothetical protein
MTAQEIDDLLSGKNRPAPTREVAWIKPPEKAQTPTAPSQAPKVSKGVPPSGFSR